MIPKRIEEVILRLEGKGTIVGIPAAINEDYEIPYNVVVESQCTYYTLDVAKLRFLVGKFSEINECITNLANTQTELDSQLAKEFDERTSKVAINSHKKSNSLSIEISKVLPNIVKKKEMISSKSVTNLLISKDKIYDSLNKKNQKIPAPGAMERIFAQRKARLEEGPKDFLRKVKSNSSKHTKVSSLRISIKESKFSYERDKSDFHILSCFNQGQSVLRLMKKRELSTCSKQFFNPSLSYSCNRLLLGASRIGKSLGKSINGKDSSTSKFSSTICAESRVLVKKRNGFITRATAIL